MAKESPAEVFISGAWPAVAAWLSFTIVSIVTTRNCYFHLLNFTRPDLQPHVLRIIFVLPIYAFCTSLCLSTNEDACFVITSGRDIWEAVVIYSFLTLIIEYMGGEHMCLHSISQNDEAVPHLFPLNICLPPIQTDSMIRVPKKGALQFVAVKPIVAITSIIAYSVGQFHNWYYQWLLFIVYNLSYSVALYALYLIYWASHEQEALQSKRPLLKFVSVKMIVFLTFWQAILLPIVPLPGSTSRWEDFILSFEMLIFTSLMNSAFSWTEFALSVKAQAKQSGVTGSSDLIDLEISGSPPPKGALRKEVLSKEAGQSNGQDSSSEPNATPSSSPEPVGKGQLMKNVQATFCPRDIMQDASVNFSVSGRYKKHMLMECAQEYEEFDSPETPKGEPVDLLAENGRGAPSKLGDALKVSSDALKSISAPVIKLGRSMGVSSDGKKDAEGAPEMITEHAGIGLATPGSDLANGTQSASKTQGEAQTAAAQSLRDLAKVDPAG